MADEEHQDQKPKEGERRSKEEDNKPKDGDKMPPHKPRSRWPLIIAGSVALAFMAVVAAIVYLPDPAVTTDDAYVTAHYATVAPRVSGQVAAVLVDDNRPVKAGDLLVVIDDRDFRAALQTAEAQLERDRAQVANVAATIQRQPAVVDQSSAQVSSSAAQLEFAQANARRYRNLSSTGAGTLQDRQQAETALHQAEAAVAANKASEEAARREIAVQEAQRQAALATLKGDEAQVAQARLNLSYTRIIAPIDGEVAQRSVQVGNFVAPGAALMSVVPMDQIYIEASYREVSLRHVLPGQHVRIHLDAYDIDLDGVVDSLPPASGAAFAPIQPNNATGNFTKIVQRLPVKITLSPGQDLVRLLRIGFSVETTIDTGLADVAARQQGTPARITAR